MLDSLGAASVVRVLALAGVLSWNQPLGCHQLSGVAFSPYHQPGQDPGLATQIPAAQLQIDAVVVGLSAQRVRLYGCDPVLEASVRELHLLPEVFRPEIALGAWLSADLDANAAQIECLLRVCQEGLCDTAVVGNEVLLRGDLDEETLLGYLAFVRAGLPGIPVTTAEPHHVLVQHPRVLAASDVIFAHLYPYWGGVSIQNALAQVELWYEELRDAANGAPVVIAETGWPSCGETRGRAIPNAENAMRYLYELVSWARQNDVEFYYFEAFDEPWKVPHEGEVGRCWGLFEEDYTPKPGIERVFDERLPMP